MFGLLRLAWSQCREQCTLQVRITRAFSSCCKVSDRIVEAAQPKPRHSHQRGRPRHEQLVSRLRGLAVLALSTGTLAFSWCSAHSSRNALKTFQYCVAHAVQGRFSHVRGSPNDRSCSMPCKQRSFLCTAQAKENALNERFPTLPTFARTL